MWQIDCQNLWRAGTAFEVREVDSVEDKQFIEIFATSHNLYYTRKGNTVLIGAPVFRNTVLSKSQPPGDGTHSEISPELYTQRCVLRITPVKPPFAAFEGSTCLTATFKGYSSVG